ncbi:MAG: ribosomal L7Ae/L30e/S12e/Gadd45 family protein [Clostridia bacterium]|nr:ribosomal L7Ae/L30e/S12e/Gadd45 family protein [Clostridia bacterium]
MGSLTAEDKLLSTLGLCARARKLVTGTPMVCEAMRSRKPAVLAVLEASDTSDNTHHKLVSKCTYYQVPLYRLTADTARLAHAVGKTGSVASVGVTDESFYKALVAHLPPREDIGEATIPHLNE